MFKNPLCSISNKPSEEVNEVYNEEEGAFLGRSEGAPGNIK
jgi:hypothetical protein